MRYLVTGGAGFLGRYVVEQLEARGDSVFVPRRRDYNLVHMGDVYRVLSASEPEVVIHLAARVGGIGANVAHPASFFFDNAMMGLQLMKQARLAGVRKFVTVGTACEYPENAPLPLREDSIWDGYPAPATAPYGLAKKTLLVQAQVDREEHGFNSIHVIPTNLYGPRDNVDPETSHVVPGMIRRFSEAKDSVTCWGTGTATREFIYVADAAHGIVMATDHYDEPEPVNLGTGQEVQIAWLADTIASLYHYEGSIEWDASRPDGTPRRVLDISRASAFGFEARVELDDGLRRTVDWFEEAA